MDLDGYINADGFVTAEPDANHIPGEGNGWLQTGLAHVTGYYRRTTFSMFGRCRQSAECPLIWRSPYKRNADDFETIDDYWGAAVLSPAWSAEVLVYAKAHSWNFSLREADSGKWEYRFDRFPHFPPFLKACARAKLSWLDRLVMSIAMLEQAVFIGRADGNMKAYLFQSVAKEHAFFGQALFRLWVRRVRARYGTVGKSWAAYFGAEHPLSQFDQGAP